MISLKSAYEKNYKDILHDISDVYIPLDKNWNKIGISISGGADSALLGFLLCKIITDNQLTIDVHVISNVRMWKLRPWQSKYSLNVFEYLKNKFQNIYFTRHEGFIASEFEWGDKGPTIIDEYGKLNSGDIIQSRAFAEFISHRETLDAYYNAVSRNPKDIDIKNKMEMRDIDFTNESQLNLVIKKHMSALSCHPFRFIDKKWILSQYRNFDIMDLFYQTRSCEGDNNLYPETFKGLNYQTYNNNIDVPECGKCFWCQERNWALEYSK